MSKRELAGWAQKLPLWLVFLIFIAVAPVYFVFTGVFLGALEGFRSFKEELDVLMGMMEE